MLDVPSEIDSMRILLRKLKAEMQAVDAAIVELRNEMMKLRAQQIARGHDPD
jgi:hypothetical protein